MLQGASGGRIWENFPSNKTFRAVPGMSSKVLREMVSKYGTSDQALVDRVIGYIENGADIGCRGVYRCSTVSGMLLVPMKAVKK